jgi:hypothetical protein
LQVSLFVTDIWINFDFLFYFFFFYY